MIELLVTLVILGIVGAIALSRLAQMQADARYASINAVIAEVQGASNTIHAQAIIAGQTGPTGQITLFDGTVVDLAYGYPSGTNTGILRAINTSITTSWYTRGDGTRVAEFMVVNKPYATNRCYGTYWEATATRATPLYNNVTNTDPLGSNGPAGAAQCQ